MCPVIPQSTSKDAKRKNHDLFFIPLNDYYIFAVYIDLYRIYKFYVDVNFNIWYNTLFILNLFILLKHCLIMTKKSNITIFFLYPWNEIVAAGRNEIFH